ncbi:SPOR domain-containing protein [Erythrobacter sp. WG]|uniref:SPOR domain-containing protein n=1 Tax=Erythrobacter sp. WG TaxID=2985510 RepID=UPI0022719F60|nr:SPOR domain-containing protein [Erythrobacter sp. WG]MCX9147111.1 tetratricopeptide repeat protein [Erythrobacter sp. WG]
MLSRLPVTPVLAAFCVLIPAFAEAAAQDVVSREVVQQLPSAEVQRLNRALVTLSRMPRDRDTLLEAGQAALGVGDLEAAVGFFGRAADVDPGYPGVAQGLGAVYLRSGRAGEALVQFDRALAAGGDERALASDRALSLDLVGDQTAAQSAYFRALQLDPADDEARRRLAVSFAISGNRARFEETLRPLLDRRDMAAQRARAFGLAIMGESDRAAAIVEQVMPRDLATRLVPYLGYMPRLTKPQQAAAANLGIFPRAADIGRDDPRLARFAAEERGEGRLAPSGPPLGTPTAAAPASVVPSAPAPAPSSAQTRRRGRTAASSAPAPAPSPTPVPAPASQPARVATVAPVAVSSVPPPAASAPAPVGPPAPTQLAAAAPPPVAAASAPMPAEANAPALAPAPAPSPAPRPAVATLRVADAFADLGAPPPDVRAGAEAVDISRIVPRREIAAAPAPAASAAKTDEKAKSAEKAKPKPKEPPKPKHPSRVWVQVATGRKVDALAFDWKRLSKTGGASLAKLEPNTAKWGQTNRLLVGPITSRDKAEALVRELKKKDMDVFLYVSPEGEEIQPLK